MDQRKIHMLVREIFPKMKWKVPVAIHHCLLPGLAEPEPAAGEDDKLASKMSKSKPSSGIFIHDSDEEIRSKIKKAWCPEGVVENNPLLAISRHIIFHEFNEVLIERPVKFGGNITYTKYAQLESDFSQKKLHPSDLKNMVEIYLNKIIVPLRKSINLKDELVQIIKKSV
jgi:tyrosyl-tRNA synthetase